MKKEESSERLFSESEAAAILGMSPRMLAERRRARKIEHVRDGRYYIRYRQSDIDGYLSKFATGPLGFAPTAHTEESTNRHRSIAKQATPKRVLSAEEAKALKTEKEARRERAAKRHKLKYGMSREERFFREYFGDNWSKMVGENQEEPGQTSPGTKREGPA